MANCRIRVGGRLGNGSTKGKSRVQGWL